MSVIIPTEAERIPAEVWLLHPEHFWYHPRGPGQPWRGDLIRVRSLPVGIQRHVREMSLNSNEEIQLIYTLKLVSAPACRLFVHYILIKSECNDRNTMYSSTIHVPKVVCIGQ